MFGLVGDARVKHDDLGTIFPRQVDRIVDGCPAVLARVVAEKHHTLAVRYICTHKPTVG